MKSLRLLALLSFAAFAFALRAQDIPDIKYEKTKLGNGLEVILVEDHRLPLVAVNVWYHVGAANEVPGRTGFAHLFEHMMFAGSKHVPRGMADQITEAVGATDSNGSTWFDRTNYFDTWPSDQLELGLWIQSDRMGYLLDVLDQAALSNQQDVVRNERRQRIESVPYGIVDEALYHNLFPKAHPYHAEVMGSHADIQAASLGDIRRFFKQYYTPNNATLAIVGDIDKARALKLVDKYFGTLKRGPDVPPVKVETPPIAAERKVTIQDRIELPRIIMGWLTPSAFKPGDAELDAAGQILGGGKSSRLYKKLVYEMQIAQDVDASQSSFALSSIFSITVTARPGHTNEELQAAIDAELDRFRKEGPDAKELERAVNTFETSKLRGIQKVGELADTMNYYNQYTGDPGYLAKDIGRYRALTTESVRKAAETLLAKDARVVVYGVPGKQDLGPEVPTPPPPAKTATTSEAVNKDEPWRRHPPAPGPRPRFELPLAKSFKLANGLTVIHYEQRGLPIVSARLVLKSGSEANPASRPGLANYTAEMLDEGTTSRSATQLADDIAQLGTELTTNSASDSSFVATSVLSKNFAPALAILADVALHPAFAPEEIKRQQASRLASLQQAREDPPLLVRRIMAAALYGENHPFGYLEIGTEDSAKATTREDLAAFWKSHYSPANAALVVAGDISADELRALAEKSFGEWSAPAPVAVVSPEPRSTKARIVLVDKPDAPQTATRVAKLGPPRDTPDYPSIVVMNAALGGLFSSRISHTLREDKGYTYAAYSGFAFARASGVFSVRTNLRTDVTAPGVREIFKEIEGMRSKPVGAEELKRARDSQVRSLPGNFETTSATVGAFADAYVYDLGLDYYRKLPARLNVVTPAAMLAAARKYLAPETLTVVLVGDRAKIEPEIAKLDLGPIEHRDAEARVIDK